MLRKWLLAAVALCEAASVWAACEKTVSPVYPPSVLAAHPIKVKVTVFFDTGEDGLVSKLVRLDFNEAMDETDRNAFKASIDTALKQYKCAPNAHLKQSFGFAFD